MIKAGGLKKYSEIILDNMANCFVEKLSERHSANEWPGIAEVLRLIVG